MQPVRSCRSCRRLASKKKRLQQANKNRTMRRVVLEEIFSDTTLFLAFRCPRLMRISSKREKNFHDMGCLRFRNKVNPCILLKYPVVLPEYCKKVWTKYMKKSQKIFCICKNLSQEVNKTKSLNSRDKTEQLQSKFCKNTYISRIFWVFLEYIRICVVDN